MIHQAFFKVIQEAFSQAGVPSRVWKGVSVLPYDFAKDTGKGRGEAPRKKGHFSTNAPFLLSKVLRLSEREVADRLTPLLEGCEGVERVDFAEPGFLNIWMTQNFWEERLGEILEKKEAYGVAPSDPNRPINVEFVSVNPTGPLHAGHGRGAVYGDVISNLLAKTGYAVTREYYINDGGGQALCLGQSVGWFYEKIVSGAWDPQEDPDGDDLAKNAVPKDFYQGGYIRQIARKAYEAHGDRFSQDLQGLTDFAVEDCMEWIKDTLEKMGIFHDVFTSEKALYTSGVVEEVVNTLTERGYVYEGTLAPPKKGGAPQGCPEKGKLKIFASTRFGDSQDRALTKKDGSWTYFAGDIAYHREKIRRGFSQMIDVWGADHGSHVDRVQGALKALVSTEFQLRIPLCQMVRFKEDQIATKMSKRSGNFVTLEELIQWVGKDYLRFFMLSKKLDAHMDFDLDKVVAQTKDNPLYYIQYAYARCHSVLRGGEKIMGKDWPEDLSSLSFSPEDYTLMEVLADYPRQIQASADSLEPHRLVTYLYQVAHIFHGLWSQGNQKSYLRFLFPDQPEKTQRGLALVQGVRIVLKSGLEILGVTPQEVLGEDRETI